MPARPSGSVSRRDFLAMAGATAGLTAFLAACGSAAPTSAPASSAAQSPAPASPSASASAKPAASSAPASASASARSGGLKLPSYSAANGPKPDLPSTGVNIDPGFLSYPKNPVKSVSSAPGTGTDVSVFTWLITQPPTPFEQNAAWQEINKQLNANMKINMVAFADLNTKFSTLMAGSELPDIFLVPLLNTVQQLPQFLQQKAADLTPHLGGDAIKDYPNLAAIPTLSWRSAVYNGAIYGVPIPISAVNTALFANETLWDASVPQPTNTTDFKKILQQLTNASAGHYAVGSAGAPAATSRSFWLGLFGAPNNWKLGADGKLTKDYETEESKAATAYLHDLVAAGVWYPDSGTLNLINGQASFVGGKYALWYTGWPNYQIMWNQGLGQKPPTKVHAVHPFGANGGKGTHFLGAGYYGILALKKAPDARVKEMLRILNYLAAPFGSQESLLLEYGVKDVDYTLDAQGNPQLTAKGKSDTLVPWNEIGEHAPVLYNPTAPEFAKSAQADEQALIPLGVEDPTVGFYSETNQAKGASIGSTLTSGLADIVAGRRPMSDYDQVIKDWRANGGDQIRTELEKAIAAAK